MRLGDVTVDPSRPCLEKSPVRQEKPISRTPALLARPSSVGHPAGVACFPVIERLARLSGRAEGVSLGWR